MKSLKKEMFILVITFLSLFILSINSSNNVSASISQTHTKYVTRNAKWANTFKRQGYSYSLLYGNHDYILTNLSKKQYNKIVKNKVRFQIRHIGTYKNAISFNLVSKGNKYNIWANYPSSFYYTNSHSKTLKPIVKLEGNIFHHPANKKFKKLSNMIRKIKNKKDKSIAKNSYYQLKIYLKTSSLRKIPYILIGNNW
ncbi:hypothetical protein WR164_15030 [Philodulcilactobacillus myokoensis]|uniref:Uncharacterized protein n=1 Tax=Philodulcilactobacillus myokoensis TaxID=2929573 RepID=A0A9W6B237_9LACO|nr:hypothetical protein [Philodulcilactobacillus myokoensis]GLB47524.1 hypothetical protein WR164_15030 [Philodulcilactobacillus myokoensis]